MKKWILSICALVVFCASAQETQKLTASKHNEYGLDLFSADNGAGY
ncbi:MAG: hypothetical protein ACLSG8_05220 [Barnesiella sp.]